MWLTWQISTALGIFLGATIPESWPLEFALPLTFIAMLVPMLKDKAMVAAALSAGAVALLAAALPYKLGLVLAALVGIGVGDAHGAQAMSTLLVFILGGLLTFAMRFSFIYLLGRIALPEYARRVLRYRPGRRAGSHHHA